MTAPSTVDAAELSATDLLAAYQAGTLSPVEATRAVLARIEERDPSVNAFCLVDAERALASAHESEQRWLAGSPRGLLDGVPVSIKDILVTKGWPTLRGSHTVSPDQKWDVDAPSVARLREHGAVLTGKVTTPELGWKGVTDSPLYGVTTNPWDTSRTAGGSSGGSAAAVALGMGPLSVGTDGGGSVRIPGSFSGVFAHKPTYGRVPLFPASPFGTLSHIGPMANTVADAALMLDVLSGADSRDWSAAAPVTAGTFSSALADGVAGKRIAFSPTLGYADVDPKVAGAVADAVRVFADLGATVDQVDPGFADPVESFHVLWFSGVAASVEALADEQLARMDAGLQEAVELGRSYSALDYLRATATRMALGQAMGDFHQRYDLLVTPTMPITAFEAGVEVPAGSPSPRWTSWTPFTYAFNMTQQPAASVPCGLVDGLPVGLQVVGARWDDAGVLAACRAFEAARPWSRPPFTPSP
ncbi:aspartyl-tRNA(Asn)/glutamyl-tRNA(Gln) amidotransferase subunit A [Herbihabitans rhizosphaerae]|uniref:Aspartyl-tRNA(Asn)/glutamyl-tRNA(Gln) amidotransferase subunit A n=1 Tax=Herbihabitans rhizosphaerae TaxID=1872711 RepID=A0A4Q7KJE6_9PSEU|nr:amidase [Herbihabitans rhizosphaerae]RZS36545.1 aspartyl-tRNA(Asn)/glutamyl-tRNA(Gln) amidotransferase subunit A [Herbihabitans rhizosphaerae]